MSDETPEAPEPEPLTHPSADEAPTAETATPATGPTSEPGAPGAAPTAPPASQQPPHAPGTSPPASPPSGHFLVPKWVAFALAGLLAVGVGFAIGWFVAPGDSASRPIAQRQIPGSLPFGGQNGASTAFLGVATKPANGRGAQVAQVESTSPAAGAGLKVDDVITKIDKQSVASPAQLARLVRAHDPGQQVTVTYTRSGKSSTVKVTLGDRSLRQDGLAPATPGTGAPGPGNAPND